MKFRNPFLWMMAILLAVALVGCTAGQPKTTPAPVQEPPKQQTPQAAPKQWSAPPALTIDTNKQYFATLQTSLGDIRIELFVKDAPKTVNNFVFLAREKFYDGVIFHRIIKDFMVQTGDPKGNGTGGPGYKFADELPPKQSYSVGMVAMANSGANTNGSQFFLCTGAGCKGLDSQPNYTQFGRVVGGADVLQKIAGVEVVMGGSDRVPSKPVNPPVIKSVVIEEK